MPISSREFYNSLPSYNFASKYDQNCQYPDFPEGAWVGLLLILLTQGWTPMPSNQMDIEMPSVQHNYVDPDGILNVRVWVLSNSCYSYNKYSRTIPDEELVRQVKNVE